MTTTWSRGVDSDDERIHVLATVPRFPDLQILALLSHGNDLDVFDVWCARRRTRCVLKVVRGDRVGEQGVMRRFRREGELLLQLSHPNIVRVYEMGELPVPYLLEEALTGHTLASLLGRRGLGWSDLVNLADQLTSALAYLHDRDTLHLDLKPSNIIAEAGRAKLIDFSLAHCPAQGPSDWGTPGYFAPEQEFGGMFSAATDVWGLGMVLKEAARRRIPTEFRQLINRSLSRDSSERPTLTEYRMSIAASLGRPYFDSFQSEAVPVAV